MLHYYFSARTRTFPTLLAGAALAGLGFVIYRSLRGGFRLAGGGGVAKILPLQGLPRGMKTAPDEDLEKKKFREGTMDVVDEASMESFPASDSPAW